MNKNIIQDNYTFTLRDLKSAWQLSYNEDLEKEYSGFVNLLKLNSCLCICTKTKKKILQSKVTDLYWDFDRLSTSGQETLESITKLLDVPTEEEMNDIPLKQHKERLLNDRRNYK
jgi:hypothetical protein